MGGFFIYLRRIYMLHKVKRKAGLRSKCLTAATAIMLISPISAMTEEAITFDDVVVTGTRETESKAESTATIDAVSSTEITDTKPAHPTEIMDRIPGVHIAVTNGEGHTTSIRQPITTAAVYLYLEDGIPTRSTGFFNHNALYEVNIPQSGGIEITKGPGTALYGSDAIGGVVNVLTRPAPLKPEAELTAEGGENGWYRGLFSGGNTFGADGFRVDVNVTHTDGWRDGTEYDRESGTVRWDHDLESGASIKTVLTTSNIDQQTAGNSRLTAADYYDNPTKNLTPISFRKVEAARLSVAYEKETDDTLVSITPYVRDNYMELMPNWQLSYDPVVYETENKSYGLQAKYRKDFAPNRTRVIIGADIDYSPGSYHEDKITPTITGDIYTSYVDSGTDNYDYDVDYTGISPYLHVETSPTEKLRLNAGVRYDDMEYDYTNNMSVVTTGSKRRPVSQKVDFDHLSPKVGASYQFTDNFNGFASYRQAFRAPGESQLFRQGSSDNTVGLQPVKADSYEVGVRGKAIERIKYEVSLYHMTKKDDILSYKDPVSGATQATNSGETLHKGIEIGLGAALTSDVSLDVAYSYSEHTYEKWIAKSGATNIDFSGKRMESAPKSTSNVRLKYSPEVLNGGRLEMEWVHMDKYWLDQANTYEYKGHDIINLRGNVKVGKSLDIFARLMNANDKRYATTALYKTSGFEYAPGMPRTLYAGLTYKWSGE